MIRRPPRSTLFPYNDALPIYGRGKAPAGANVRSVEGMWQGKGRGAGRAGSGVGRGDAQQRVAVADRKSTRLNSSHSQISYAVFCLKKKKKKKHIKLMGKEDLRSLSDYSNRADSSHCRSS